MFNSFILTENFTNGFSYSILSILSMTSIICGILVITSKNPIVSVLFLIGLFLSVASYLMTLGLNFIGLSYLLVSPIRVRVRESARHWSCHLCTTISRTIAYRRTSTPSTASGTDRAQSSRHCAPTVAKPPSS